MQSWGSDREVEKVKAKKAHKVQSSVASLPESQQDQAMEETERASQITPSIEVAGHLLHVAKMNAGWEVWVNCEDMDFTGLCVGVGDTAKEAVQEAVTTLEAIVDRLQGPPFYDEDASSDPHRRRTVRKDDLDALCLCGHPVARHQGAVGHGEYLCLDCEQSSDPGQRATSVHRPMASTRKPSTREKDANEPPPVIAPEE